MIPGLVLAPLPRTLRHHVRAIAPQPQRRQAIPDSHQRNERASSLRVPLLSNQTSREAKCWWRPRYRRGQVQRNFRPSARTPRSVLEARTASRKVWVQANARLILGLRGGTPARSARGDNGIEIDDCYLIDPRKSYCLAHRGEVAIMGKHLGTMECHVFSVERRSDHGRGFHRSAQQTKRLQAQVRREALGPIHNHNVRCHWPPPSFWWNATLVIIAVASWTDRTSGP